MRRKYILKKICHVTSAHPAEDGRIFRRACVSSANAGYETYLVEPGDTYEKNGVHIVGIGKPKKSGRLYRMTVFAYKAFLAAKELDADLFQLHDPELLPYAMKLKKMGKKVIFDSHENYVEQFKNKPYLPKPVALVLSKIFSIYSKRIYSVIDGITYPGNGEDKGVFDGLSQRVVATDNLPWLSELYEKYDNSIKREPNTACYVGTLDEARGITQMIKACYAAKCKLYLAGSFFSIKYRNSLESMEEYSCVEYLGTIDRNEVVNLLQKTSIGLSTLLDIGQYYKMQNLPTKVYEYMSMALPVVINDSPYNESINKEISIGYCVNPMNIEETGKAIRNLLDNVEMSETFGKNGRRAIRDIYCWDREQQKLISMYRDILGE